MPEYYTTVARQINRIPEFYMMFARKIFSPFLGDVPDTRLLRLWNVENKTSRMSRMENVITTLQLIRRIYTVGHKKFATIIYTVTLENVNRL